MDANSNNVIKRNKTNNDYVDRGFSKQPNQFNVDVKMQSMTVNTFEDFIVIRRLLSKKNTFDEWLYCSTSKVHIHRV